MNMKLETKDKGNDLQLNEIEFSEPMHQEIILFELSASLISIKETLNSNWNQKSLTLVDEMQTMLGQLEQELLA